MPPVLLWLRRNLRLYDNAALIAAAESGRPIIPVFVLDDAKVVSASRWWLHHSLLRLDSGFAHLAHRLLFVRAPRMKN